MDRAPTRQYQNQRESIAQFITRGLFLLVLSRKACENTVWWSDEVASPGWEYYRRFFFLIDDAADFKRMEIETWAVVGYRFHKLEQLNMATKAYTRALKSQPKWMAI